MPRDYDSDKPKRSWREIDRNKDSSKHRQSDRSPVAPYKQARAKSASKVYRSNLDAFFEGDGKAPDHVKNTLEELSSSSKESVERTKALAVIKEAGTSSAADKAVSAYLKEWKLPPDFDVLAQVLTCADEVFVEKALKMLEEMLDDKRIPRRSQVLEQRLRRVKTLAEEPDLQDKAGELIKKLRLFT